MILKLTFPKFSPIFFAASAMTSTSFSVNSFPVLLKTSTIISITFDESFSDTFGFGVPRTISDNSFFDMELMSSGERPGTAGKILKSVGGRFVGGGVVPLRLKFEKSSTIISVVDESSVALVEDVVVVETVVNVVAGVVIVVVVIVVVVEVVVDVIRIRGCCRMTVRSPPLPVTSGFLSTTSLLRKFESSLTSFEAVGIFSSFEGF